MMLAGSWQSSGAVFFFLHVAHKLHVQPYNNNVLTLAVIGSVENRAVTLRLYRSSYRINHH
jgi:hypothetical protein